MSNVSTTVKIVVSMVVVAALVATRFSSSKTSTRLKGARKLQFGGLVSASSQGLTNSGSAVNAGDATPVVAVAGTILGGKGNAFGNGAAVGTSNGFASGVGGAASATGTSGGNSTAASDLTLVVDIPVAGFTGGVGTALQTDVGAGGGAAGGNAVFGPSLSAAIAAAIPVDAPPAAAAVEDDDYGYNKGGKKGKKDSEVAAAVVAPTAPAFNFVVGLPTGGGGGGFGAGSGFSKGSVDANGADVLDNVGKAYGSGLSNGFGFGVGSGVAVNSGGESAGGSGGGTALGAGNLDFEIDDVNTGAFANDGSTVSSGGAGGYVGFEAPAPTLFAAFLTPPPAATP